MAVEEQSNAEKLIGRENLVEELTGKSDRAVAIVGAALLDSHMSELLTSFFVEDYAEVRSLLDEDRPVGNFGTRIRLSYVLGLISEEERDDLWAVLQVREFFIREMGEVSFTDDPIREWCYWLRLPKKVMVSGETMTPRRLFVFTIALLVRQLGLRIDQASRMKRRAVEELKLISNKG